MARSEYTSFDVSTSSGRAGRAFISNIGTDNAYKTPTDSGRGAEPTTTTTAEHHHLVDDHHRGRGRRRRTQDPRSLDKLLHSEPRTPEETAIMDEHVRACCRAFQASWGPSQELAHRTSGEAPRYQFPCYAVIDGDNVDVLDGMPVEPRDSFDDGDDGEG